MRRKLLISGLVLVGLVLAFVGVIVATGYQCCNSAADGQLAALADRRPSENEAAVAAGPEHISLHSVPLRCPLVKGLGCGSESKPILKKLDGDSSVAGTWLNHAGITLAVFWKDGTDAAKRSEAVTSAFQGYPAPTELSGDARDLALKDFFSGVSWYRTGALDELSGQEADIVASRWVDKISSIIPLPKGARESLHCQLSERMRRRFVKE
jgi:hypothetical protein